MKRLVPVLLLLIAALAVLPGCAGTPTASDQVVMSKEKLQATIDEAVASALAEQEAAEPSVQPMVAETIVPVASDAAVAPATSGTVASTLLPLEVTESGYSVSEPRNGTQYIHYVYMLHNPNPDPVIDFPTARVAARGEDGAVLATHEDVLMRLQPNESMIVTGQLDVTAPVASIEAESVAPEDYSVYTLASSARPDAVPLETTNIALLDGRATGEITNPNAFDLSQGRVAAAVQNSNGDLVTGESTFVSGLAAGQTVPFSPSICHPN